MTDLATVRRQLVMANRILANEGILDAFGHVTIRHPEHADRFLMAWARAPELVEDADLLELTLDGTVLDAGGRVPYLERFIHGAIYEQRPEVMAVCHNHTRPWVATGQPPLPDRAWEVWVRRAGF